jgi:ParB-like chromosome segregation protein Spo0J
VADLSFHEAANLFPLMKGEEYEQLKADIKAHGLREPVWTYQGKIIDGRNRYRACKDLGIEPSTREWDGKGSLVEFVVSMNLHRRHLTAEQRKQVAAALLKETPHKSDRQIGKQAKADHKTVAAVRAEMEGRGEIPHVEARTDTRGRRQPPKNGSGQANGKKAEERRRRAFFNLDDDTQSLLGDHELTHNESIMSILNRAEIGEPRRRLAQAIVDGKVCTVAQAKQMNKARVARPSKDAKDIRGLGSREIVVDALGTPVPESLRDVFADQMLHDRLDMMRRAVPDIKSAASWNPFLELGHAIDGLQDAITALKNSIPYAIHGKCDGKGCDGCRGKGWLPEWRYKEEKFQAGDEE